MTTRVQWVDLDYPPHATEVESFSKLMEVELAPTNSQNVHDKLELYQDPFGVVYRKLTSIDGVQWSYSRISVG